MTDLRISGAVVDDVAEALRGAAAPLELSGTIMRGAGAELASPAVASALSDSTSLQGVRADVAKTAIRTLGGSATGSAARMFAADAALARNAG